MKLGSKRKVRIAINHAGELWARVSPVPDVPRVDFDRFTVIFVAAGPRPTNGYRIYVTEVVESKDRLVVHVHEMPPALNAEVKQGVTNPCQFVFIAKTRKTHVEFVGEPALDPKGISFPPPRERFMWISF